MENTDRNFDRAGGLRKRLMNKKSPLQLSVLKRSGKKGKVGVVSLLHLPGT